LATDHWSSATWQCAGTPVIAETSEMGLGFFNFQDESHPQENIDVFSGLNYNSHSPTKRGTTDPLPWQRIDGQKKKRESVEKPRLTRSARRHYATN